MRAPTLLAALLAALAAAPAAADVLARLADGAPLRLAVREDAAPLSAMREGVPSGHSVAICTEVARRLGRAEDLAGVRLDYVPVTAETRFAAISGGEADLLCGAATVTISRRREVEFSLPVFVDGAGVMIRAAAPVASFADFAGGRLGVRAATTTEAALRATLERTGMPVEVVAVGDHADGLAALRAGEVDGYLADRAILYGLAAGAGGEVAVAEEMLTLERHALALPKGDEAFRAAVDRAISDMYRDGTLARLFADTFPNAAPGAALEALWLLGGLPD